MSLKERLMADLKTAMKEKDKLRKDVITMVRASVKQKEVDERVELEDADIENIISKQLKEKKASIEEFKKGNREDLVEKTNDEIEILLEYLPEQLADGKQVNVIAKELLN